MILKSSARSGAGLLTLSSGLAIDGRYIVMQTDSSLDLNLGGIPMTTFPKRLKFWTALLVVLCMSSLDIGPAAAGLASSTRTGATTVASVRDADLLVAQRVLENKVVAQKLHDYGVTPAEAQLKLASMSDQDLHRLATASKGLPSGGDATGAVIGILIVVILVILILRLTNKEVVVK
jgi:hypothetical protein